MILTGHPQTITHSNVDHIMDDNDQGTCKASTNPMRALTALVQADFDAVNDIIVSELHSEIELIPQLASHLIQAGGKRIRPLLTLACATLCNYKGTHHRYLAAAVEFIHTATLLHDDVVDGSMMRRGNPSANALWGNQASVLVGDFLFSRAFQMMVRAESLEALQSLSDASAVLAEGEVMQLVDTGNLDIVEQRYIDIVKAKTATLFESACDVSAIVSGQSPSIRQALKTYGSCLGLCFQIIDDVLDYESSTRMLGKTIGDDLREKKVTLPIIFAYHHGNAAEQTFWNRVFQQDYQTQDADLAQAQAFLHKHNALAHCRDKALMYANQAKMALDVFPDSSLRTLMQDLVYFTVNREY